jgi:hypothetical protein
MRYFYADANNQPIGPYTPEELKQLAEKGTIKPETWVAEEGGAQWQPYSKIAAGPDAATAQPQTPLPPARQPLGVGTAVLAFLCCMPIGFMQWGQTVKGWMWLVVTLVIHYSGVPSILVGIPGAIDYWMCYLAQRNRQVGEWEFFPTK